MTSETYPSVPGYNDRRTITFGFDAAGRLSSLNSNATTYAPGASVSGITYTSHGALASETYGNNLIHAATYNNRLQTSEIKLGTSGNPTSILDLVYNYGATTNNGNIQSVSYSGGGLSYSQTFSYDSLNRLATAQENSGVSWSQTNGYDRYANRWIALPGGGQSIYCNTSNNRITGWSYDASGDLLNDGVTNYTYDAEGHIKTVNSTTAYVYDGGGQRVRKLVGENVRFVYGIGGELIAEFDGSTGSLKKEYVYGGGTVAIVEPTNQSSNGTRYSTPDHLGSPRVVSNASGGVVSRHDYMPFGEELFAGTGGRTVAMGFSVADGNRKKFTGYERDSETGLDFAQARYYSSTLGRFTSHDPFGGSMSAASPQSFNRYAYVGNNPVNRTDPTGMFDAGDEVRSTRWVRSQDFGVPDSEGKRDHIHTFDWVASLDYIKVHEEVTVTVEGLLNDPLAEAMAEFWSVYDPQNAADTEPFVVSNPAALESGILAGQVAYRDANGIAQCARLPLEWQINQENFEVSRANRGRQSNRQLDDGRCADLRDEPCLRDSCGYIYQRDWHIRERGTPQRKSYRRVF